MGICCYGYIANRARLSHNQRDRHDSSNKNNIFFKQLLITLKRFFRNTIPEAVECTMRKLDKLSKQWKNILFVFCRHENRELQKFDSGPLINKHLRACFLNGYQKLLGQTFWYKLLIQVFVAVQNLFSLRSKTNTLKNITQRKSIFKLIPTQRSWKEESIILQFCVALIFKNI